MKKAIIKSEGNNYSAIEIGKLQNLAEYSFPHPKLKQDVPGKLFVGETLKTTGTEVSFQIMPANSDIPFLHSHLNQEELYVFIKGEGQFQVDNDLFDIQEGTIIRVAPKGKRTWRNNSDDIMILMVIQAKANTLEKYNVLDGFGVKGEILK
ncbi:cupin domain-containing protein [Saccharicrinis aurantiacus]|uniref:cupin domain-containing protein n=1 Tax=Saccharicrinis aurantiacus TaxID=1849719 RepID=UPI00249355DC|nr:cupin domain-containing protein [Saccharicrinis aurantiacus]